MPIPVVPLGVVIPFQRLAVSTGEKFPNYVV